MTTLKCNDCGDDIEFGNDIVHTWQQWQCPVCNQWVDWREGEFDRVTQPTGAASNSRYNVADMQGNAIPDELVAAFSKEVKAAWDLKDEDGDHHSPAYYLEGFMGAHREYLDLFSTDTRGWTQSDQDHHMIDLDRALEECDEFDNYVNKLFGYSGE